MDFHHYQSTPRAFKGWEKTGRETHREAVLSVAPFLRKRRNMRGANSRPEAPISQAPPSSKCCQQRVKPRNLQNGSLFLTPASFFCRKIVTRTPLQPQEPETPKLVAHNEHLGPLWDGIWLRRKGPLQGAANIGPRWLWRTRLSTVAKCCLVAVRHYTSFSSCKEEKTID